MWLLPTSPPTAGPLSPSESAGIDCQEAVQPPGRGSDTGEHAPVACTKVGGFQNRASLPDCVSTASSDISSARRSRRTQSAPAAPPGDRAVSGSPEDGRRMTALRCEGTTSRLPSANPRSSRRSGLDVGCVPRLGTSCCAATHPNKGPRHTRRFKLPPRSRKSRVGS